MNTPDLEYPTITIKDIYAGDWKEHPRFRNIWMKTLTLVEENPHASINLVRVPKGCQINSHSHASQVETIYILGGEAIMFYQGKDHPFVAGNIVAMPAGIHHSLRNERDEDVVLMTIFTPPL